MCTCVHRTLREELASKDVTLKQTVSEFDKQTEEKRRQAVTIRWDEGGPVDHQMCMCECHVQWGNQGSVKGHFYTKTTCLK